MIINGFLGTSLIDFPGKISSLIYTSPCNFRCPFCQNTSLIEVNSDKIEEEDILKELKKRKKIIEGLAITGGEPTLHDDLDLFLERVKNIGLKTKLDTNGYRPEKIKNLIDKNLLDYIAMDIKTSFEKYSYAVGLKNVNINNIKESIDIIKNSKIDYEFRTTAIPTITEKEDFYKIGEIIKGAKLYSIQQFVNKNTYDPSFENITPYTIEELNEFKEIMEKYVENVRMNNV